MHSTNVCVMGYALLIMWLSHFQYTVDITPAEGYSSPMWRPGGLAAAQNPPDGFENAIVCRVFSMEKIAPENGVIFLPRATGATLTRNADGAQTRDWPANTDF